MSQFMNAARAVAVAALVGGYAWMCPATATADSNSATLAKLLSKGYDTSNCKAQQMQDMPQALAAFECDQNSLSGGPDSAAYVLYDNATDTADGYKLLSRLINLVACAPGVAMQLQWKDDSSSGTVECGTTTKEGVAAVVWTNDRNDMAALIAGSDSDVKSLYKWWNTNG
jgi:hypothetical protein